MTKVLHLKSPPESSKPTTARVAIHEGLLLHFSPRFPSLAVPAAASSPAQTLDEQTTFEVDTTSRALEMLVTWVYTGDLASSRELALTHADLIELYLFAKRYEFIVLQRYALDQIFRVMTRRSHVLASHFATDFPRELPGTKDVRRVFETLAPGSRLQQWLIEVYVHHYSPSKSTYNAKDWSGLPSEFLSEVMHGKARLLEQSKERSTGFASLSPGNASPEKCPCCTNLCDFHEHDSELERQAGMYLSPLYIGYSTRDTVTDLLAAVCGGNDSAELKEEIFSANFGEAQQTRVKKEIVA